MIRGVNDSPHRWYGEFPENNSADDSPCWKLSGTTIVDNAESIFDYDYLREFEAKMAKALINSCVRDLSQTDLYKKIEKSVSLQIYI